jgi:hypothetical protein
VPEDLIASGGVFQAQHPVGVLQGTEQAAHLRGGDRQRPAALHGRLQAQVKLTLAGRQLLLSGRLQQLQLCIIVRRSDVLDVPRPAGVEYTICTAVAPDAVFTVRTYGTGPRYSPRLVRKSGQPTARTCRSENHPSLGPPNLSQVRF